MNWKRLNKACEGSFKKFIFLSCNLASSLAIWTQSDILRNKRVKYLIYVNTLKVKRGGGGKILKLCGHEKGLMNYVLTLMTNWSCCQHVILLHIDNLIWSSWGLLRNKQDNQEVCERQHAKRRWTKYTGIRDLEKERKITLAIFFPTRPSSSAYTYNPISNQEMMFVLDHESYT